MNKQSYSLIYCQKCKKPLGVIDSSYVDDIQYTSKFCMGCVEIIPKISEVMNQ